MRQSSRFCLKLLFSAILLISTNVLGSMAQADNLVGDAAILRTLDKVTARTLDLTIPVGSSVKYGTLEITVQKCLKRPPEETPETYSFLDIKELKQDEAPQDLFMGWMMASSPALNALEHPVYDVWVIDCKINSEEQSTGKE